MKVPNTYEDALTLLQSRTPATADEVCTALVSFFETRIKKTGDKKTPEDERDHTVRGTVRTRSTPWMKVQTPPSAEGGFKDERILRQTP